MVDWFRSLVTLFFALLLVGCSKVPQGYVGLRVNLLGTDRGIDGVEELSLGRYFISINQELHLFPTFQQNHVWTQDTREGSREDQGFVFQSREGMEVGADLGISYHIPADKALGVFTTYRRGVNEITDTFLRNHVRDALNTFASTMEIEQLYGEGRVELLNSVEERVRAEVADVGINIDRIYMIGSFRLPDAVRASIDLKIQANQIAQQRENEIRQTRAEAEKRREAAQGVADAIMIEAKAQAEANKILSASLTDNLIKYRKIDKWNGIVPKVSGDAGVLLNMGGL